MNIDDCDPNPCVNGATCEDEVQDYTCHCTIEFNKGMCKALVDWVERGRAKYMPPPPFFIIMYLKPLHTIGKVSVNASIHKAITHYW